MVVAWWQWRWQQLSGNMAVDMAARWWQQRSGGKSVAAVAWQYWGGGGITAEMLVASVLQGGSMAA
jgi:hypothetical protein